MGFNMSDTEMKICKFDFEKEIFIKFQKKFKGCFFYHIPDHIPVYLDKKDNLYVLTENTELLLEESLRDKVNYLLNNRQIIYKDNVLY